MACSVDPFFGQMALALSYLVDRSTAGVHRRGLSARSTLSQYAGGKLSRSVGPAPNVYASIDYKCLARHKGRLWTSREDKHVCDLGCCRTSQKTLRHLLVNLCGAAFVSKISPSNMSGLRVDRL
jgi:hypothetical protein